VHFGQTQGVETVEYAPGRLVDLFGTPAQPTVLLWHGQQTDARTAVRPLAKRVAAHGLAVVAPDWNSHAEDGGRAELLQSVSFARQRAADPDRLVLVGWSMGGVAAAGLTIHESQFGARFAHTVCLAGAFMVCDPISGRLLSELPSGGDRTPLTLLHGIADDVVPVAASREFAAVLQRNEWPVQLAELAADHGSIAGASYDRVADRYSAARDRDTLAIAADVAARIAAVAGRGTAG
jgi:dipeptidyl aminopeptidase/acylaminoacyl peptidase